ncbi:Serologically defined colon cancer antigen 1, partial [Operophtera brumata]
MSWEDINLLVKTAQENNDPIASCIKHLKLATNHIALLLTDPYQHGDDSDDSGEKLEPMTEANTVSNIIKARRTYWFEKFYWFISSDNYLAKVVTRAWWVSASQVSKSAPTGEYLGTGSFMIRGKKHYVLTDQLSFGFSFMFRLEDSCIERHRDERKPVAVEDSASDVTSVQEQEEEEIVVSEGDDETVKETEDDLTVGQRGIEEEQSEIGQEDSSDDDFPDTHIKVDHGTGEVTLKSKARTISEASDHSDDKLPSFPSLPKKGGKKPQRPKPKQEVKKEASKRGQKGKMKKIKEKRKPRLKAASPDADTELLSQLTGAPHAEDELLFAVPVVAPYSALLNYKYKVKLTPGTSKRGKAAKTAVQVFLRDKAASNREKDLLKAVKVTTYYYYYKRGKAAKTAVQVFLRDKAASNREKDLLKAVKVTTYYYYYKRGKAAKTAVQVFLRDKAASNREKDLLKAVKRGKAAKTAVQVFLRDKAASNREKDLLKAVKRGKAAKTAVQVFLRDKAASNREKDLLKAVKRGKAAKTAVQVFLRDKAASNREKDLLKAVK